MEDARHHDHQQQEDAEVGQQLADQGRERAAAGAAQPCADAAAAELGADGVARRDRDHDVQHGRQDGAQQELRVVQGWIGEHVLLDHQRPDRSAQGLRRTHRGHGGRGRGDGFAQAFAGDVAGGEELVVVEDHDLWPPPGQHVAFEIRRNIDRRDCLARADRTGRGREIVGALRHLDAGCRGHRLNEHHRGRRAVGIDHRRPRDRARRHC